MNLITPILETDEEEEKNWEVSVEDIVATSPNWEKSDSTNRHWKAKYGSEFALFSIEDDRFWKLVEIGNLVLQGKDSLKVQWDYYYEGKRKVGFKVLKVLYYNGKKISDMMNQAQLDEYLGKNHPFDPNQPRLFD